MSLQDFKRDAGWALFLDRDGVINKKIPGDYVKRKEEFEFLPGVTEAISIFSGLFKRIFVVTNQQGIGKGLMTESDLEDIHHTLKKGIEKAGGKIDRIYFCPYRSETRHFCRKPNIGMALQAKKEFLEIQFRKSIMVGDSLSDMRFGRNAGMTTILISASPDLARQNPGVTDYCFPDLLSFARYLQTLP